MRILITGATGIVGKKLLTELNRFSYDIRILTRKKENYAATSDNFEYAAGNLEDKNSLDNATRGIDTVIHLAAITHTNNQKLYYQINIEGTKNLLRAAEKNGVKNFIFISSRVASIEGGAYAHSKLLAEEAVKSSQLNWIILRPAEIYGAGEKEAVSKLIHIIKNNKFIPIIGNGQYSLSPVYIDDIIECIAEILQKNSYSKKTYTLAGPEEFTFTELTDKISKVLKVKRIKIFIPIFSLKALAFFFYLAKSDIIVEDQIPRLLCAKSSDISLAKKDLNFHPRSIVEYIKQNK